MACAPESLPSFDLASHLAHIDRAIAETRRLQAQRDAVPTQAIDMSAAMPWIAGGAVAGVVAAALNAVGRMLF
jgi:type III secretory pathway component EscV